MAGKECAKPRVLYATLSGIVTWSGGKTVLAAGATTADPDHQLVKERPDLWTEQAPAAHLGIPRVENASARPGARRGGTARG